MALNYSLCRLRNPLQPDAPRKVYAKAQITEVLSLKMLGRKIAAESTCSRADVEAVLICMVEKIIESLREGYQVELGELGKLRLHIASKGISKIEDFTSDLIKSVRVRFAPAIELKNSFEDMVFTNVPSRESVRELLKQQRTEPVVPEG